MTRAPHVDGDGGIPPRVDQIKKIHDLVRVSIATRWALGRSGPHGASIIDLENRDPSDYPKEVVLDLLKSLQQDTDERADTSGFPQIPQDVEAHKCLSFFFQRVFDDRGGIVVVGEEASQEDWGRWRNLAPGEPYILTDPLDGSYPYRIKGEAWSINSGLFIRGEEPPVDGGFRDTVVATLTSRASGGHLLYLYPAAVYVTYGDSTPWCKLLEPDAAAHEVVYGSVAIVAAHGHQREGQPSVLFDTSLSWGIPPCRSGSKVILDPSLVVDTNGGAPSFHSYLTGDLETIVLPRAQTVHDTFGILAVASISGKDNYFFLIGGQEIGRDEIMRYCSIISPPDSPGYHPVPPMVISRSKFRGRLIAERMAQYDGAELRASGQE